MFWFTVGTVVWFLCVSLLAMLALDYSMPLFWVRRVSVVRAVLCGVSAILLFAAPFGWVDAAGERLPLCVRGHEEYVQRNRGPHMVGKVMVSGGTYTSRIWVCEERAR
jgi:hypothetical protein